MQVKQVLDKRGSGILLHITSLPGDHGIGDFGPWAYKFAEFLRMAGQSYWQVLPLTPIDPAHGNSPYHSCSAYALNPLFLSPEVLNEWGWVDAPTPQDPLRSPRHKVDYSRVLVNNRHLIDAVFRNFHESSMPRGYDDFCEAHQYWLDDYAMFMVIKDLCGGKPWYEWPPELRDRSPSAIYKIKREYGASLEKIRFVQFLLYQQWMRLKTFCNSKGIRIFGDMPFYVVLDSADLWSYPELFNLGEDKMPLTVAGVPPDYFSATGQLWGNPVYRWDVLKETGYAWWIQRTRHNLALFDIVRIDHFRGFVAYWEVPAGEKDAVNGKWVEAPAWDFFECIKKEFGNPPIVAEDLGFITPDVIEVRRHFGFPGMKILLFAFGEDLPTNPYAPHNLETDCIVYTGTHDNNTTKGWFETETSAEQRERIFRYIGRRLSSEQIPMEFIRLAMMSVAKLCILPMQDILGLGEEARMNRPATNEGNWQWRMLPDQMEANLCEYLRGMTEIYGRT